MAQGAFDFLISIVAAFLLTGLFIHGKRIADLEDRPIPRVRKKRAAKTDAA